jgi:hypothetical protein
MDDTWWPVYEVARSEGSIGQLASGSREGGSGHSKTLTLGLGVFVENVGGSLKARPWGPLRCNDAAPDLG